MAKRCFFPKGILDSLHKPTVAFVRLNDSIVLDSVLESSVPIRFFFLIIGPSQSGINYSECGRAMGALMADWVRGEKYICDIICLVQVTVAVVKHFCLVYFTGVLS